jgi:hypothetical protein
MMPLDLDLAKAAGGNGIPLEVTVALVAGAFSVIILALNSFVTGYREGCNRRRDLFSKAFAAVASYREFPYVVRRRRSGSSDTETDERVRISEDLRRVQQELSYYSAWMATESQGMAVAYGRLVEETRRVAGRQIHEAWLQPPATDDQSMNMPDLGLAAQGPAEQNYLAAAARHLSIWPWRR